MKIANCKLQIGMTLGLGLLLLTAYCLLLTGVAWGEEALRAVQIDGQPYVALTAVARAAGGAVEWLPASQKVRLRVGDGQIVVTPGASVVAVGRSSVRLPDPPRWVHGAVHVPVRWFLPLVEPFAPGRVRVGEARLNRDGQDRQDKGSVQKGEPGKRGNGETGNPPVSVSPTPPVGEGKGVEEREAWKIHTVIIDPGHGGKDQGAVGPTGLEEKEVALKVALHLKAMIEQRLRVRAVLTRSSDEFVSLGRRARIALENDGRVFISLHCNAANRRGRGAGGTEVYFLSEARTEEAREVARRENAALAFEENGASGGANGNPVLRGIFEGMSSDQYLKESQDLAAEIRGAVARAGGMLKDRGVKQAGFYVMKGTQARMPSVLVEMAFISSPREERLLRTESFQKQLAGAILEGVRDFKAKAEQAVANK